MALYFHAPAAATAATKTVAACSDVQNEIVDISWSYDAAPTGGSITVESPSGTTIWKHYITAGGPGQFHFGTRSLKGASGQAMVVTLASGAGAVSGILAFNTRTPE